MQILFVNDNVIVAEYGDKTIMINRKDFKETTTLFGVAFNNTDGFLNLLNRTNEDKEGVIEFIESFEKDLLVTDEPINESQFMAKVISMYFEIGNMIETNAIQLMGRNVLPFEEYRNNFELPKIYLHAISKEIEFQFKPLYHGNKELIEKIRNHLGFS